MDASLALSPHVLRPNSVPAGLQLKCRLSREGHLVSKASAPVLTILVYSFVWCRCPLWEGHVLRAGNVLSCSPWRPLPWQVGSAGSEVLALLLVKGTTIPSHGALMEAQGQIGS